MAGTLEETRDLHLVGDFLPEMPEVTGRVALLQRLVRRLTTPPGIFRKWWPNEGINVPDFVLSKVPTWRIRALVEAQCERDEQVREARARVVTLNGGLGVRVDLFITDADGSFAFTMNVTEAAASLVALQGIE